MPPVTRRSDAARDASAIPRVPQRVAGRRAAPASPSRPPSAEVEDDAPQCPVCLDALAKKRSIILVDCAHRMHRTCGLKWMETRENYHLQQCPLCRSQVGEVQDEEGNLIRSALKAPYGPGGEPTKIRMMILMERVMPHSTFPTSMQFMEWFHSRVLRGLWRARRLARLEGREREYIDDVTEEIEKLRRRRKIIGEMITVYNEGGMREMDSRTQNWNFPWNMQQELEELRQRRNGVEPVRRPQQLRHLRLVAEIEGTFDELAPDPAYLQGIRENIRSQLARLTQRPDAAAADAADAADAGPRSPFLSERSPAYPMPGPSRSPDGSGVPASSPVRDNSASPVSLVSPEYSPVSPEYSPDSPHSSPSPPRLARAPTPWRQGSATQTPAARAAAAAAHPNTTTRGRAGRGRGGAATAAAAAPTGRAAARTTTARATGILRAAHAVQAARAAAAAAAAAPTRSSPRLSANATSRAAGIRRP